MIAERPAARTPLLGRWPVRRPPAHLVGPVTTRLAWELTTVSQLGPVHAQLAVLPGARRVDLPTLYRLVDATVRTVLPDGPVVLAVSRVPAGWLVDVCDWPEGQGAPDGSSISSAGVRFARRAPALPVPWTHVVACGCYRDGDVRHRWAILPAR